MAETVRTIILPTLVLVSGRAGHRGPTGKGRQPVHLRHFKPLTTVLIIAAWPRSPPRPYRPL